MKRVSIGWIAKSKRGAYYGGHEARCKVYGSAKRALSSQRMRYIREDDPSAPCGWRYRKETDEEVLANWDILEAFVEVPDAE